MSTKEVLIIAYLIFKSLMTASSSLLKNALAIVAWGSSKLSIQFVDVAENQTAVQRGVKIRSKF
jgi:hypothetical protein